VNRRKTSIAARMLTQTRACHPILFLSFDEALAGIAVILYNVCPHGSGSFVWRTGRSCCLTTILSGAARDIFGDIGSQHDGFVVASR
jgi:hypothetical protein